MIRATVRADSKNEFGQRITTMSVVFPRFILAELNTHRVFSRNSASSRAIPFNTMVKMVRENPFIPMAWQKDHKGMQGSQYLSGWRLKLVILLWLFASKVAVLSAKLLSKIGVTKQLCNRILEPFMWHTVIVTSTEFENFFDLRCPKYEIPLTPDDSEIAKGKSWKELMKWRGKGGIWAGDFDTTNIVERLQYNKGQAEIHMMALAEAMYDAYQESQPAFLSAGEYHIPFGDNISETILTEVLYKLNGENFLINKGHIQQAKVEIAVARCARVSYLNYEGSDDYEKDFKLFKTLKDSKHMSPFEHVAIAMCKDDMDSYFHMEDDQVQEGWCRNFRGFIQLRSLIE